MNTLNAIEPKACLLQDSFDMALVEQPWDINEFVMIAPAGVCWHIDQNTPGFVPVGRLTP